MGQKPIFGHKFNVLSMYFIENEGLTGVLQYSGFKKMKPASNQAFFLNLQNKS